MAANPSIKKREKERARQERQREKEQKRHQRKEERARGPASPDGADPAIEEAIPAAQLDS